MDLERLSARLRPRGHWEAMDLGFALARRDFSSLWRLWWLTAAGPALLLLPWLHGNSALWLLALWWLKPFYDAVLLAWLARALFGERLSPLAALRRLPSAFPRRLWPQLLWRRFSLTRAFTMPATLLEGQRGRARRERLRVLAGTGSGATWLTLICAHLEPLLALAVLGLVVAMAPAPVVTVDPGTLFLGGTPLFDWLGTLAALLGMSVIAPFYVAAGFALYLARRTALEAWDLELLFRRAAAVPTRGAGRRAGPDAGPDAGPATGPATGPAAGPADATDGRRAHGCADGRAGTALLLPLALGVALLLIGPAPGLAADAPTDPAPEPSPEPAPEPSPAPSPGLAIPLADLPPADAEAAIDAVLAHPDFGETRTRMVWTYVGPDPDDPAPDDGSLDWLPIRFILALAEVVKWLLLIGLAMAAVLLAQRLVAQWRGFGPVLARDRAAALPTLFGTAPDGPLLTALPADLAGAVRALLADGATRAALALLYRAQVARLRGAGLPLPDSATETECLAAAARAANPAERSWLARLTALWQRQAWAHQPVDAADVLALLASRPTGSAVGAAAESRTGDRTGAPGADG